MPRETRVLLISNLFPTPADPTRGIFTARLAERLQRRCVLRVVCPLPWLPVWTARGRWSRLRALADVPRKYVIGDVQVHSPKYSTVPGIHAIRAQSMFLGMAHTVARLHRETSFHVINCHWLYPDGLASIWIGRLLGIPVVLTALGSDVNLLLDVPFVRQRIVRALWRADGITAVSAGLARRIALEGLPLDRVAVTVNGVDTERFVVSDRARAAQILQLPEESRRLLFVGKLESVKGVACLIDAFARLAVRRPHVVLYLVGDGTERAALERLVAERGLAARVRFIGAAHPARIPLWMSAADVLCLPSLHEGCPNVVLEAFASGRPVVASQVGGVPELMQPHTGLMVTPGGSAGLESALEEALHRPWDPWKIRAHALRHSWETAADAYCDVYGRIIQQRAAIGRPVRPPAAARTAWT
jgi:glycosyltransferase involved in cell wall biosynthesis